jgi:acetyltransferase-like isoleucine patch superfamily enzyme
VSYEIKVPHEIVNDDLVTISQWNHENGAHVRSRDTVALIETSKAVIEVEAGADGYIEIVQPEGSEVGIGAVIAVVREQRQVGDAQNIDKKVEAIKNTADPPTKPLAGGVAFSRKARLAMEENGLNAQVFSGLSLVREKNVLDYLQSRETPEGHASLPGLESAGEDDVVQPVNESVENVEVDREVGLFRDAYLAAADRNRSLLWLVFNYVWRTWFLSNLVRWAPRFAILRLHRWRGVKIGQGCFVDPTAILETAHPHNITMGNDVRIAAQVIIMTHIKPPHFLRDAGIMGTTIEPVQLEDSCFIGVGAIIMPGVTVGRASVVASGAVVLGDVAPNCMVAGNPAKVVKRFSLGK